MPARHFSLPLFGMLAGQSAWLALGTFGPTDGGIAGLLPPLWSLLVLSAGGALTTLAWWPPSLPPALIGLVCLPALAWLAPGQPLTAIGHGGLALAAWLLVASGWLLALARRQRWAVRGSATAATLVSIAWLGLIALALRPLGPSGDEPHYLVIAESLRRDGDVDVGNNYAERHYRGYFAGDLRQGHVVSGYLGQQFPFHGVGAGVLATPGLIAGGPPAVRASFVLIAAAALGLLWATSYRATGSIAAAWAGWAMVALPAPLAIQSSRIYPDGPATLAVAAGLWLIVRLQRGQASSAAALVLVGAAITTLPFLHVRLAAVAVVLGVALLVALRRQPDWPATGVIVMAPAVIGAAVLFATSFVMFGTLDPTAPFRMADRGGSLSSLPAGVLGMLTDQEFGLLPYAPALVLCIPGVMALWRRAPVAAAASAIAICVTILLGGIWAWWGGDSAPARFLVPTLPAVGLIASSVWAEASVMRRAAMGALTVVSASWTTLMATVSGGSMAVNQPDGRGTIFEWMAPQVDLSLALPSLFRGGATPGSEACVAALWTLTGLAAAVLLERGIGRRIRSIEAAWAAASLVLVFSIVSGVGAAWWWRGVPPQTPDRAALKLLQDAPRRWLTLGYTSSPWGLVDRDTALQRLRIQARVDGEPDVQLHVPFVPAGRYELHVAGRNRVSAPWHVELGRDALPFGSEASTLILPVPLRAVRVVGPPAEAFLRPLSVDLRRTAGDAFTAWRGHRFGDRVIYEQDAAAFVQPDGFWLPGDRSTLMLVTDLDGKDAQDLLLAFEAGPAPVHVEVGPTAPTIAVDLAPFERRSGTPISSRGRQALSLRVEGGFEASQLRPGTRDRRWLGAFVSIVH